MYKRQVPGQLVGGLFRTRVIDEILVLGGRRDERRGVGAVERPGKSVRDTVQACDGVIDVYKRQELRSVNEPPPSR